MKYFIIAGEASGDLHAAGLMKALLNTDPQARFRYYGGDRMRTVADGMLLHYRKLAYMGFIPVLLHLRTILRGMTRCKRQIADWRPDAVILVDYPGFNLSIARYVKRQALCPVFYYIAPKIWAWKEGRIKAIRRDVSRLYSILPFEVDFFERKHRYPITYVGNPTADEVQDWQAAHGQPVPDGHTIALLPGSRLQEIKDNLSRMLIAATPFTAKGYTLAIAAAPSVPQPLYDKIIATSGIDAKRVQIANDKTFELLSRATAALVTSGTATLETALFRVPQVVCYYVACGRLVSLLRRLLLKVPYVSLVNLICCREVVPELVADGMTTENIRFHLSAILPGQPCREKMLRDYKKMAALIGPSGAPQRAAHDMVSRLRRPDATTSNNVS